LELDSFVRDQKCWKDNDMESETKATFGRVITALIILSILFVFIVEAFAGVS